MIYLDYFYWCGVVINVVAGGFIALIIWVWFIWPFVDACSLTRCYVAAMGNSRKASIAKLFWYSYADVIFGRNWTAKYNNKFRWEGVGKWRVYKDED